MRTRLLLVGALALPVVGATTPASATCHPEKPSTCETCRITGVYFDENGIPRLQTECP